MHESENNMLKKRILIAVVIGLAYGIAGHLYRSNYTGYNQIGDVYWALYTAQELPQAATHTPSRPIKLAILCPTPYLLA